MPGKPAQPGGISDPFILWSGRRDVAMKYDSEELRDFWAISPRVTVTGYVTQVVHADRVAREDITTAEITKTEVTTDGGLEADDVEAVRHGGADRNRSWRCSPPDSTGAASRTCSADGGLTRAWEAPDTWIWPDDFAAYAEGRLDASQVRCALCQHGPYGCPAFGTAGHFARIDKRHGRMGG